MTADQFRKEALRVPGAIEGAHVGHPDFRIGGKIFASLGAPDEAWGMVKLTPEEQQSYLHAAPKVFRPCNGAWGRRGYTNVYLASASVSVVRPALAAAANNVLLPSKAKHG